MRFASQEQRQAIFAKLRRGTEGVKRRFHRLSPHQKELAVSGLLGAAAIAASRPNVTHVPRKLLLKRWGPHVALYAAGPMAGYLVAKRNSERKSMRSIAKRDWQKLAGLGALGAGSFFGERALFHSIPALLPKRLMSAKTAAVEVGRTRQLKWLLGHSLPLGILAAGSYGVARSVLPASRTLRKKQRALPVKGLAARVGAGIIEHGGRAARHLLPLSAPPGTGAIFRGVEMGLIPATASYQVGKAHAVRKKRRL